MKNTRFAGAVFAVTLMVALFSAGWLVCARLLPQPLSCSGNVVWDLGSSQFEGSVTWRMDKKQGIVTVNGKLTGSTVTRLSRNIYFSYEQRNRVFILRNTRLLNTYADTASRSDLLATLPAFYYQPGKHLSLHIDSFSGGWLFSTSKVPSLYCHKR